MIVRRFDSGLLASNMYVVEENEHALVIDPARNTQPGESLIVDLLIITHEHYDHISGVNIWKERFGVPLLCSEVCASRIIDSKKNQARYFDAFYAIQSMLQDKFLPEIDTEYICEADITFKDETKIDWQGHTIRLIELPGHSPGSIGIILDEERFFSGDSLLKNLEVELGFPGGSREQWEEISKPRVDVIPKGTIVHPGHFESFLL